MCCAQCASKFGKLSSGHRTGKGQFYSNSKERQCQKMLKLQHNFTHLTGLQNNAQNSPSRASNYVNRELPDIQAGFTKAKGTRDQNANIHWIMEKAREKNTYFCFIYCPKPFDCVDHNKFWKILEMGIPDHLTCVLQNLYAGQRATVRTRHGTTDCFQIEKEVHQGCVLSLCLFNFYV